MPIFSAVRDASATIVSVGFAVPTVGKRPPPARYRFGWSCVRAAVQEATGETVELAYVDQGYIGEGPNQAAAAHGIQLEVVKLPDVKGASSCCPDDGWSNGASAG